jgi:hypothetical protein
VALRSLAKKVDAPIEDILGAEDLRGFLQRTDGDSTRAPSRKRTFGPAARMQLLGERDKWANL